MSAPGRADTAAGHALAALAVGLGAWLRVRDLGVDPLRNDEIGGYEVHAGVSAYRNSQTIGL